MQRVTARPSLSNAQPPVHFDGEIASGRKARPPEEDQDQQRHVEASYEIRRHARVVGTFPDGKPTPTLVTARLKCTTESK